MVPLKRFSNSKGSAYSAKHP